MNLEQPGEYVMKKMLTFITAACVAIVSTQVAFAAENSAPEMPEMPKPQKEHAWLEKLTGEWESEMVIQPPGQPTMTAKGEERSRMVGGFWYIAESAGDMMGMPFTGIMTLGYDINKKQYVGTWVDSMTDYLWKYKGKLEGDKLTLEAKGPCPLKPPGTMVNFRETLELMDKDHKVFTSSFQEDDGSWTQMVTIKYTRKK
jgi:hypothetical protein